MWKIIDKNLLNAFLDCNLDLTLPAKYIGWLVGIFTFGFLSLPASAVSVNFNAANSTLSSVTTSFFPLTPINAPVLPGDATFTVPFTMATNAPPIGPLFGLANGEGRFARFNFTLPAGFADFNLDLNTGFDDRIAVYLNDSVIGIDTGLTCSVFPNCTLNVNATGAVTPGGGLWDFVAPSATLLTGTNELTVYVQDEIGTGLGGFAGEMSYTPATVPLPATLPHLASVLAVIGFISLRRRRTA